MLQNLLILGIFLILSIQVTVEQVVFQYTCLNETTYCIGSNTCRTCPRITPFCNSERRECTANPSSTESCPSGVNGAVPALDSCTSYIQCLAGEGRRINCPFGFAFDPASRSCQRKKPCYRFNCFPWEGTYVSYQGDRRLYAFCSGGRAVSLLACPPGFQYIDGRGCQFVCPGVGSFTDYSSCERYYQCVQVGVNLIVIPANCGANEIFFPDMGTCMPVPTNTSQLRVLCATSQAVIPTTSLP